ncbi:hypothetical protein Q1J45_10380 [Pseudomonas rhodesiae]
MNNGWKGKISPIRTEDDLHAFVDEHEKLNQAGAMTNITREEIDVKLQLIEERLDRKVGDIATAISDLKSSNQQAVLALSNAKWWAIGTAIAVLSIFLGTLQWGLSAQKEENARFNAYVREDVRGIAGDTKEISKSVTEMRMKLEHIEPLPQK